MDIIQWIIFIFIALFVINRFLPTKGITNIAVEEKLKINLRIKMFNLLMYVHRESIKQIIVHHLKISRLSNLSGKLDILDKDKEIVVICQSGMRSTQAAKIIEKARL